MILVIIKTIKMIKEFWKLEDLNTVVKLEILKMTIIFLVNEGDVFQYNLLKNVGDIKKYMTNIIQTFWYSQMN